MLPLLVSEVELTPSEVVVVLLGSMVGVLDFVGVDEYHIWPEPPATAQPSRL